MKKKINIDYRRKRESKTNYNKRLKLLMSKKPRLVIRKTLKNAIVQLTEYSQDGDLVRTSANSRELQKHGWQLSFKNTPAVYLTGFLLGKKALSAGMKEAIADIGLNQSINGSKIYAALKGAVDAGLKVPCSEEAFPDEKRIFGEHIKSYASLQKKQGAYEKRFSGYEKKKLDLDKVKEMVEETKKSIAKASFTKETKNEKGKRRN